MSIRSIRRYASFVASKFTCGEQRIVNLDKTTYVSLQKHKLIFHDNSWTPFLIRFDTEKGAMKAFDRIKRGLARKEPLIDIDAPEVSAPAKLAPAAPAPAASK